MKHIAFERTELNGSRATYSFREAAPDVPLVEGMFEVDLERYEQMSAESGEDAIENAIYWLTPIQEDRQYWVGMKVFFHIYKHYLEHGTYIEKNDK